MNWIIDMNRCTGPAPKGDEMSNTQDAVERAMSLALGTTPLMRAALRAHLELMRSQNDAGLLRDALAANTKAATDVLAERRRQIEREGWDASHDDSNGARGELPAAAACYAMNAAAINGTPPPRLSTMTDLWPWHPSWFKCTTPRRDLVKAGALILAELERLDRRAALSGQAIQPKEPT